CRDPQENPGGQPCAALQVRVVGRPAGCRVNIVTHLLVGWTLAEHTTKSPRDRALIAAASVVPDLDGLGLIADVAAPSFGWGVQWYERFHHVLLHGMPGALLCTALLAIFAS